MSRAAYIPDVFDSGAFLFPQKNVLLRDDMQSDVRTLVPDANGQGPDYRSDLKCLRTKDNFKTFARTQNIDVSECPRGVVVDVLTAHLNDTSTLRALIIYTSESQPDEQFWVDLSRGRSYYDERTRSKIELNCVMRNGERADGLEITVEFGTQPAVYLFDFAVVEL